MKSIKPIRIVKAGEVVGASYDAQVRYMKEDVGSFSVRLADIAIDGANRKSYDILWLAPGYGLPNTLSVSTAGGILCDLGKSVYRFLNNGPCTLYLRVQRPMGYKNSPGALGMWEPADTGGSHELVHVVHPQKSVTLRFTNGSTSHMVPRMVMEASETCVHILSFSVWRRELSDMGVHVDSDELALQVNTTVAYIANDGVVGELTTRLRVKAFNGDSRLDVINPGPPPDVRIMDLRNNTGPIGILRCEKFGNLIKATFSSGKRPVIFTETVDGLDPNVIYALPYRIGSVYNLCCLCWSGNPTKIWKVCEVNFDVALMKWVMKDIQGIQDNFIDLPGTLSLCPVLNEKATSVKVTTSGKGPSAFVAARMSVHRDYAALADGDLEDFADVLLGTITTILRVMKVSVEVAGFVGLLSVPITDQPAVSVPGAKQKALKKGGPCGVPQRNSRKGLRR